MEERLTKIEGLRISSASLNDSDQQIPATQNQTTTFVFIPADATLSLQELHLTLPEEEGNEETNNAKSNGRRNIDPFLSLLVPYYRLQPGEKVDLDFLIQRAKESREAGCATNMCPHVSPHTLQRAAEEGTIERICLSSEDDNAGSRRKKTIYMYYDDSAHLKRLQINTRATNLSKDKNDDANIYGDAFVAKLLIEKLDSSSSEQIQVLPFFVEDLQKI